MTNATELLGWGSSVTAAGHVGYAKSTPSSAPAPLQALRSGAPHRWGKWCTASAAQSGYVSSNIAGPQSREPVSIVAVDGGFA